MHVRKVSTPGVCKLKCPTLLLLSVLRYSVTTTDYLSSRPAVVGKTKILCEFLACTLQIIVTLGYSVGILGSLVA